MRKRLIKYNTSGLKEYINLRRKYGLYENAIKSDTSTYTDNDTNNTFPMFYDVPTVGLNAKFEIVYQDILNHYNPLKNNFRGVMRHYIKRYEQGKYELPANFEPRF